MGWSHPDIQLEDFLKLIKGFVDILILASGYQSSGSLAHWDPHNFNKAFQWGLFFQNVLRQLRCSDGYQDSVKELDAALSEITSNPFFPQGLAHLSSDTLHRARDFVLEHLIHTLPLRDTHLRDFTIATIEMDLDELRRTRNDFLNVYLNKLVLQNSSVNPDLDRRGFMEDSIVSSQDIVPNTKIEGCCTSCAVRVKSGQIRQPEALGISAELKSKSHQKALRADPSYKPAAECLAIVLTDLGTSLKLAGNTQEGIQKYYEAIKIDPHYAPAYYNLGVVYSEMMQYDMALNCYEKAALERPMYAEAYCNMGVIYKNRGDLESAIACYERCLAVSPNFEIAKNNMAIALTDLGTKVKFEGDTNQGVAYYKKALYYNWHYADAMYNLGVAYGEMLNFDMAIVFYERAFHFNPHCAEACNNLGVIYKDRDNLDKAVECYQLALSIKPNFSQSLNNLGVVYTVQGKMDAAAGMIEKAIVANPTYAEAYNNLGVLYRDAGNITLAIEAYEQCLKIDPDSRNAGQNRLLAMNYIDEGTDDKLFEAHRDWGKRFMRLYPQCSSWNNPKDPKRPLVIGYVSPDYFTHSVSYFIEAPLVYHDYANYKVVVYSAVVKADAKTNRFRDKVLKKGGIWRDIYGIDEKKVATMVREDKVDILVELTGHTANNKLGMMACRPAPVQVTWIGYPNTTGLPAIDYRITDALADPPDTRQKHVEELIRLPECFLCYTPSPEAGPVCPTPALSNGFITFGSFNNLAKITPKVLQVWARILCAVPNSRLVVKCKPFCCDSVRQRFLSTLEQLGLESLRVDLLPLILLNHDHMQAYALMDISLDTFPYAGTTTTCESLYMGVPCVTMGGSVHAHNVGVSLLKTVGLGHLVAKNEDEYVQSALQLASDVTALSNLRMGLRDLMSKSPLCDGSKFILGLESIYRNMWSKYCKGDVPSSKHMDMLQQPHHVACDKPPAVKLSEPTKIAVGSVKTNGFNSGPHSCEENGVQLHLSTSSGKLS